MISHKLEFAVPLTSFGGLQAMADKARDIRDSYDGKSSTHWQAWENLRIAIVSMIELARKREATEHTPSVARDISTKTIEAVLRAASYAGWTSPYEREGAMGEHVERVAERLETKGYVIK